MARRCKAALETASSGGESTASPTVRERIGARAALFITTYVLRLHGGGGDDKHLRTVTEPTTTRTRSGAGSLVRSVRIDDAPAIRSGHGGMNQSDGRHHDSDSEESSLPAYFAVERVVKSGEIPSDSETETHGLEPRTSGSSSGTCSGSGGVGGSAIGPMSRRLFAFLVTTARFGRGYAAAAAGGNTSTLVWTEGTGGGTSWSPRYAHAGVVFSDGVVVSTGGVTSGSVASSGVHTTAAGTGGTAKPPGTALTLVSQSTFTARWSHGIARVPGNDDAFLVVAGAATTLKNDALLTSDRGANFVSKTDAVFTSGRYYTALVATAPATFVAYAGGAGSSTFYNEVRQSTNLGSDWTTLRAEGGGGGGSCVDAAMWSARLKIAYAFMPLQNRILVAGGEGSGGYNQDVWGSDDGGTCWSLLTADSDGTATSGYGGASLVVATLGGVEILVLAGGQEQVSAGFKRLSSVYRSLDAGVSWDVIASSGSMWGARSHSVFVYDLASRRLATMGGFLKGGSANDFWSADASSLFIPLLAKSTYTYTSTTACTYATNGNAQCCGTNYVIAIDGSVATIASNAFKMCTSVIWVDFTAATALTAIGAEAFQGMTSLHRVDMSGATQLANLGANAFNGCIALTTAKLASSITVIGAETFTSTLLSTAAAVNFNTVDCVAATSGGAVVFIFVCPLQLKWTEGAGGGTVWSARWGHAAVCYDDGVVVTTGGFGKIGMGGGSEVHTTAAGGTALALVTQSTFIGRAGHAISRVLGNADAFLVVGGVGMDGYSYLNDALLSPDRGATYIVKSNAVFTSGRWFTALVATGPATFVAFAGNSGAVKFNEVRQSTDLGATWTTLRAEGGGGGECSGDAAMWAVRNSVAYAFMPLRNRIILAGGKGLGYYQDVWGSDDGGTCWIQLTADSDGTATMDYNSFWAASLVVATLGDIEILVLAAGEWFGGDGRLSSVYRSIDAGVSWDVIPSSGSMWPARSYSALVYNLANTRLAISGGEISGGSVVNDFWTADATYLFPKYTYTNTTTCTYSTNGNAQCCGTNYVVAIDASVTTIAPNAFKLCTSVGTVDFTAATSLATIGAEAFHGLTKVTSVDMRHATQLSSVSSDAFSGCSKLESMQISSSTELLLPFTIVGAFVDNETSTVRVEGGEELMIVGTGFGALSQLEISLGGVACLALSLIVTPSKFAGFSAAKCSTPCLDAWDSALGVSASGMKQGDTVTFAAAATLFRGNAPVQFATASEYALQAVANFVCVHAPIISSIECVVASECDDTAATLQIAPNALVRITGSYFGKTLPSADKVSPVKLELGLVTCLVFEYWSSTIIRAKMCAPGGSGLAVKLVIGDRESSGSIKIDVKIDAKVPQALTLALSLSTGNNIYSGTVAWSPPADATGYGYVLIFTTSNSGWSVLSDVQRIVAEKGVGSLSATVQNIAIGSVLRAKVGMVYAADAAAVAVGAGNYSGNTLAWAPDEFTAVQNLQAASAPETPNISAITFIGLSHGHTMMVDMLQRFELVSFNGGTPDVGVIEYTSGATSLGGATMKLNSELTQLAVISKFPTDTLTDVVITLLSTREFGLDGNLELLSSSVSLKTALRVRVPQRARELSAAFEAAARDASTFTAVVDWLSGIEEPGNAPIVDHKVYWRAAAATNELCVFEQSRDSTSGMTCNRTARAIHLYANEHVTGSPLARATISGLPLGSASCFVVQAKNAVGFGSLSTSEVCLDVAALLRSRCEAGTQLANDAIFTCEKCAMGQFNAARGSNCTSCDQRMFTPAVGSTTCSTCSDGTHAVTKSIANSSVTCAMCPTSRLLQCVGGVLKWQEKAWYNPAIAIAAIDEDTEVHTCFNDECCVHLEDTRVQCVAALGYIGPLCGACDRKRDFMRSGFGCLKCWPVLSSVASSALMCLAFFAIVCWFSIFTDFDREKNDYSSVVLKIIFSHLQMLGILGIFKAKGSAIFNEVVNRPAEIIGGSVSSVLPIKCLMNSQAYGTFIINMLLPFIVAILASVIIVIYGTFDTCVKRRRETSETPTYKGRFGLHRCCAVYTCLRVPMSRIDSESYRAPIRKAHRLVAVLVFFLFTLFPTLVSSVAKIMNCSDPIESKRYLLADLSVTCFEDWHIVYIVSAVIFFLIYCVGIPAIVFFVASMKSPILFRYNRDDEEEGGVVDAPNPLNEIDEPIEPMRLGNVEEESVKPAPCYTTQRYHWHWPTVRCIRRPAATYGDRHVRVRFAFLFHGYTTDRPAREGGVLVVAWETIVMLRKLFVTLAGATISDAYLQIIAALMILIIFFGVHVFFQPYETASLNLLDGCGIFCLLCTQILSILYLYAESSDTVDRDSIEIAVTLLLFATNGLVLLLFACAWVVASLHLDWRILRCRRRVAMRLVVDQSAVLRELGRSDVDRARDYTNADFVWRHPTSGKAAVRAPRTLRMHKEADGIVTGVWEYLTKDGAFEIATTSFPQLLTFVDKSKGAPQPGEVICYFDDKIKELSPLKTVPDDLGGRSMLCHRQTIRPRVAKWSPAGIELVALPSSDSDVEAGPSEEEVPDDVDDEAEDESSRAPANEQRQLFEENEKLTSENVKLKANIARLLAAAAPLTDVVPVPETVIVTHASANDALEEERDANVAQARVVETIDSELDAATTTGVVKMKSNPLHTKRNAIDDVEESATTTTTTSVKMNSNPIHATRIAIDVEEGATTTTTSVKMNSNPIHATRIAIDAITPLLPNPPSSGRVKTGRRRRKMGSHGRGSILHLERKGHLSGIVARNSMKFRAKQRSGGAAEASSSSVEEESSSDEEMLLEDAAAAVDCDEECWFYIDDDDVTIKHGPYTLAQLKTWRDAGHFSNDHDSVQTEDGHPVALLELLHVAGLEQDAWYYDDEALHVQGPFGIATFQEWLTLGHFQLEHTVRRGRNGAPVLLSDALVALDLQTLGASV